VVRIYSSSLEKEGDMQGLKDKLIQAGVVPEDYRPGESPDSRAARLNKEQAERRAKIRAVVDKAHVDIRMGEHVFFFITRSKKMRRLLVEPEIKAALEKGELAIVEWPDRPDFPWSIVGRSAAERILELDPNAVRFWVRSEKEQYGVA
jgi:uncharacterized protein YaiL (DUF2058 family)